MNNAVLELFNDRLPHKPYFSDDLHFGVRIAGKERAILAKYIQFNQPHAMFWLGFDVDRAGAAIDWSDRNAPAPTLTITNPENGHAHPLYALETSIRTAPDGKIKPLKYAAAVENALRKKLEADTGYSGLICKNPNHSHWKIAVWQPEPYTLDWLADSLDLSAANDKEVVAAATAPCSTKLASGHTVLFVRAGLSMSSGCKPATNEPALTTCNFHLLWMKMR